MSKRIKTDYPGVYYRLVSRLGRKGTERMYYVTFKRDGKTVEAKVGGQFRNDMTPARAAGIRGNMIEHKELTPEEKREIKRAEEQNIAWTIEALWQSYCQEREQGKSLKTDISRYDHYLKPIGDKLPSEIILLDIDRIRHGALRGKSPQTVKHVLALLQRIIRFGVKRGLCDQLSFHIEKPKVVNLKTEDLDPEQMQRLLEAIKIDDNIQAAGLMKLALFTGMRRGELFKLQWKDIDLHRGFINIRDPKGGQDQKIPLNDGARQVLKNHIKTDSPYVFPGRGGCQRVDINKAVNRIKQNAGLPKDFRPLHGLRHVYASMLASSGKVDMYVLQKLLTHKDARMTQRYAHLRDEVLKAASGLASDIVNEAMKSKKEAQENAG